MFLGHVSDAARDPQFEKILSYIQTSTGLKASFLEDSLRITQVADGKSLRFASVELEEVIPRIDGDGHPFLQINFQSGKKILLTDHFIGFKPLQIAGLDMDRLPKVVTTPDLLSVVEAIEDTLSSGQGQVEEVDVLRRVFDAVMRGGEAVGFDLTHERLWLQRITRAAFKASA